MKHYARLVLIIVLLSGCSSQLETVTTSKQAAQQKPKTAVNDTSKKMKEEVSGFSKPILISEGKLEKPVLVGSSERYLLYLSSGGKLSYHDSKTNSIHQ